MRSPAIYQMWSGIVETSRHKARFRRWDGFQAAGETVSRQAFELSSWVFSVLVRGTGTMALPKRRELLVADSASSNHNIIVDEAGSGTYSNRTRRTKCALSNRGSSSRVSCSSPSTSSRRNSTSASRSLPGDTLQKIGFMSVHFEISAQNATACSSVAGAVTTYGDAGKTSGIFSSSDVRRNPARRSNSFFR